MIDIENTPRPWGGGNHLSQTDTWTTSKSEKSGLLNELRMPWTEAKLQSIQVLQSKKKINLK